MTNELRGNLRIAPDNKKGATNKMVLTILGAPGAGKGTMAKELSEALKIPTISTGALLRTEIASGSKRGEIIDSLISKGNFVPDEMIVEILLDRLKYEDCKNGYILDGFPRNTAQATNLENYGIKLDTALLISVSEEEIIERLTGRRECEKCRATFHIKTNPPKIKGMCNVCGSKLTRRSDDREDIIRKRISIYKSETEPLIDFFKERNLLVEIEGQKTVEETKKIVFTALGVNV